MKTVDLAKMLGIARQNVAVQMKKLVEEGVLVRTGSTRSAVYHLSSKSIRATPPSLKLSKRLKGLEEHRVWDEVNLKLGLPHLLNQNAHSILSYAFTEMLNNAIDHSNSASTNISVRVEKGKVSFDIRDFGIGIFAKVSEEFQLENEFEGLEHVLKGKQTTAPEVHSGEGIFFTSRIADSFSLRSHRLKVRIDNQVAETFVSEEKNIRGTEVSFCISANTKKTLDSLFKKHTGPGFTFDRADQRIQVAAFGGALSRSQAKRLLNGLDQFNRVTLDFRGVKEVGQGFVDEVFRVYAKAHPKMRIDYSNANEAVAFMIRRAQQSPA